MRNQITIWKDEPFLRQRSKEVVFPDSEIEKDIETLRAYCYDDDNKVFAMAAVQLGIAKRLIFVKYEKETKGKGSSRDALSDVYINPVILERTGEVTYWEACASLWSEEGFFVGKVKRPYKIKIKYQDVNGKVQTCVKKGFAATMFSHEYDHLDGIFHTDRTDCIVFMTKEELEEMRDNDRREMDKYVILSKRGEYKAPEVNIKLLDALRDYQNNSYEDRMKVIK